MCGPALRSPSGTLTGSWEPLLRWQLALLHPVKVTVLRARTGCPPPRGPATSGPWGQQAVVTGEPFLLSFPWWDDLAKLGGARRNSQDLQARGGLCVPSGACPPEGSLGGSPGPPFSVLGFRLSPVQQGWPCGLWGAVHPGRSCPLRPGLGLFWGSLLAAASASRGKTGCV